MTRAEMIAIVTHHMAGSPEAAQHTHIECRCWPDHVHRKDTYEQGCFCPECASLEAVERGLVAEDTEPERDGPNDGPRWCERCGRLLTTEITSDGAEEELAHWESDYPSAALNCAKHWREFMLCVVAIPEEHLPRVAKLVECSR